MITDEHFLPLHLVLTVEPPEKINVIYSRKLESLCLSDTEIKCDTQCDIYRSLLEDTRVPLPLCYPAQHAELHTGLAENLETSRVRTQHALGFWRATWPSAPRPSIRCVPL